MASVLLVGTGCLLLAGYIAVIFGISLWFSRSTSTWAGITMFAAMISMGLLGKLLVPAAFEQIVFGWLGRRNPPDARQASVIYLRSFDSDGDSAYPLQGGSWQSQQTLLEDIKSDATAALAAWRILFSHRNQAPNEAVASLLTGTGYARQIAFSTRRLGPMAAFENEADYFRTHTLPSNPSQWRDQIEALLKAARLIVIRPGQSDGVRWEMQRVRAIASPRAVLLFFPVDAFGYREDNYAMLKTVVETCMNCKLPAQLAATECLIGFDEAWQASAEVHSGIPLSMFGTGLTAECLRRALRARALPARRYPPFWATLAMPLNLTLGILLLGMLILAFGFLLGRLLH